MKNVVKILVVAMLVMAGCKAVQPPINDVPINYKETIVERLVPHKLNIDSLKLRAKFECDSLNRVVMKGSQEQKRSGLESNLSFENGELKYNANTNPDTIYITAKDRIIERDVPVRVEVPVEVNKLTGWQYFQIYAGRLLLSFLLGYAIYRLLKWKLKS